MQFAMFCIEPYILYLVLTFHLFDHCK